MTPTTLATSLLADGYGLRVDGDRLIVTPPHGRKLNEDLATSIREAKDELIKLLSTGCVKCRRPLDKNGTCWKCESRPCVGCGKNTGTPFIATCVACGNKDEQP